MHIDFNTKVQFVSFYTTISIIICLLLAGCTTQPGVFPGGTSVEDGFPVHGYFCGKNIPTIASHDQKERVKLLEAGQPIDAIDSACKLHDLCYATRGYFNASCDTDLFLRLQQMKNHGEARCKYLIAAMGLYFLSNSNSRLEYERIWKGNPNIANQVSHLKLLYRSELAAAALLAGVETIKGRHTIEDLIKIRRWEPCN